MKLPPIIRRLFGAESRAVAVAGGSLANPPSWLERLLLGHTTDDEDSAGITITESTALQISTVFACVRNLSDDVAKLPIVLYRDGSGRGRERLAAHPLARVLARPNPEMTAFDFRSTLTSHAVAWGNGYAEIVRLGNGRPAELWPMLPENVQVVRENSGAIVYIYSNPYTGRQVRLPSDDVLHIKGLGYDGLIGYSPVALARRTLAITAAAEKFGASFFGNSSMPKGVLEHPGVLGDEGQKNLRRSWEEVHRGVQNANRIAILEEGMKFNPITIPPEDAQFLQTRQFQVPEICRWFRMPPHKVADLSRATFSNIEHSAIEYVGDTLLPWLIRWEQEIARKLLMLTETTIVVEHQTAALLRGDLESRYKAHAIARQWGWASPNDVREIEGLNPIDEDAGGDVYLVPANMANAETFVNPPEPAPSPAPPNNPVPGGGPTAMGGSTDGPPSAAPGDVEDPEDPEDPIDPETVTAIREAVVEAVTYSTRRLVKVHAERIGRASERTTQTSPTLVEMLDRARDEFARELRSMTRAVLSLRGRKTNEAEIEKISKEAAGVVLATYTLALGDEWRSSVNAGAFQAVYDRAGEIGRDWVDFVERRAR